MAYRRTSLRVPAAAVIFVSAVAIAAAAGSGCSPGPPEDERHLLGETAAYREMKDKAFTGAESPIPQDRRQALLPLAYFPISLDYRVPAVLRRSSDRPTNAEAGTISP